MGQGPVKCCCNSKETNEINIGTAKGEIFKIDEIFSPKFKDDQNIKDLKSYISMKNNSISKDDFSNGNINDNNDEYKKQPSILINSKKYNFQKEIRDNNIKIFEKKKSAKNLNVKRVKFGIDIHDNIDNLNNKKNSVLKTNLNLKEKKKETNNSIYYCKIQSIYKGYYYRKKIFPQIKIELEKNLMSQLKELYEKYLTINLKTQEENLGITHNENSYKTLLSIKPETKTNPNLLFTKLYILKYNNQNAFYIGEITIENIISGIGILTLENGIKYNGIFENNIFKSGKLIEEDGTYYEGNFNNNNKIEGKGKKITLNNSIYIGDFINGIKEGKGNEETNEHKYEGDFKNNKKNGFGKLYYKEMNDYYEGEFNDNQITGTGKYKWSNGEIYEGTLLNGKMNGKGIYNWPDGGRYEGDYINNSKEGFGIFKWANGKIFEGPFNNGKPNGEGILISKNKKFKVKFCNGIIDKNVFEVGDLDNKNLKDDESISSISFVSGYNSCNVEENQENFLWKKNKGKNKKKESGFKKNYDKENNGINKKYNGKEINDSINNQFSNNKSKNKKEKNDKSKNNNNKIENFKNNSNKSNNNKNESDKNDINKIENGKSQKKKKRIITEKDLENF